MKTKEVKAPQIKVLVTKNCMVCSAEFTKLEGGRGRPQLKCENCRQTQSKSDTVVVTKLEGGAKIMKTTACKKCSKEFQIEVKRGKPKSMCASCESIEVARLDALDKERQDKKAAKLAAKKELKPTVEKKTSTDATVEEVRYTAEKVKDYELVIGEKLFFNSMHKEPETIALFSTPVKFLGMTPENKPRVESEGQEYTTKLDFLYKKSRVRNNYI